MSSQNSVKGILKQFITDNYLMASGFERIEENDSFMERGLIDSTGILELLEFVEETFTIRIEDEEVVPENLDSLERLTSFIESKMKHANQ
jgi:acyl carrier protein